MSRIGFFEERLSLKVGQFDKIAVGDADETDSGASELFRDHRPEGAASDQQSPRRGEPLLTRFADLRQEGLAVVAVHGCDTYTSRSQRKRRKETSSCQPIPRRSSPRRINWGNSSPNTPPSSATNKPRKPSRTIRMPTAPWRISSSSSRNWPGRSNPACRSPMRNAKRSRRYNRES